MAASSSSSSIENPSIITDAIDSSSLTTNMKYGDDDLASKRRKCCTTNRTNVADDEDYYLHFNKKTLDASLNSTFVDDYQIDYNKGVRCRSDCKNTVQRISSPSFIAEIPSGTSFGFENTFGILEQQIEAKFHNKKYLRSIKEEYVPSISSEITETSRAERLDDDDDDRPSLFDLELEAMQRVKQRMLAPNNPEIFAAKLIEIKQENETFGPHCQPATPLNEMLYGLETKGLKNPIPENTGETVTDISGEYPEYVYHVAKGIDGKMYLKVVRSLLIDKVLCGNRVSQMTRAYDDIEAVTRLLEEKEKDLELTVQIGKELLTQNNRLENRVAELETELKTSTEDRAQLIHDLHQKNELISILSNDVDDGSENETPTASKSINLDLLQKKISNLQDENKSLKQEASQLAKQTDEIEEQERKLMEDITTQLNSTNYQFDGLNLDLERQKEENRFQHEQIVSLTARLAEAEMRLHQLTTENDEQGSLLCITKENQNMLTTELVEFKERYQEVLSLLQEAQEQLRKQRKKIQPQARSSFISNLGGGILQTDSLQCELMGTSLYSENSLDSGISGDRLSGLGGSVPPYKKVFETVRCATKNGHYSDGMSHLGAMSMSSSSQPRMSAMPYFPPGGTYHRPSSVYSGSTYPSYDSSSLGVKTMSCESLASESDEGYPGQSSGVPGAPGAKDLEAALKRLTPAEVLARRAMLSHAPIGSYSYDDQQPGGMPLGIRTPDSIMSTGSSGMSNISSNQWRLPEKLQIVKPMEGSQTLQHWSRLATPTLCGLLEERPGVTIRGGRGLEDLGMQVYSLSDVEEDVDDYPGKQFQTSGCIYTYTNSTVLHPDDGSTALTFSLSQSQMTSRSASASTSRQPSCPPTPRAGLSRRNSCSTFSVNMGLASMLNERGIKAVTPSALNTPAGPNFTPTVTPCNSPEGSPTRSMSPEPLFGLFTSGADLIRRKLIGADSERPSASQRTPTKQQKIMLSRLEKRALRSLRLLEKVESVGLENIIATHPNAMSQLASGIASRSASPMAQLTSLKHLHTVANSNVDDVQFHRDQIRAVLNKGLSHESAKGVSDLDSFSTISSSDSEDSYASPSKARVSGQNNASSSAISSQETLSQSTAAASSTAQTTTDLRLRQMQRQKSRRNLKNGTGGQRPDLGTVGGRIRTDLGRVDTVPSTSSKAAADKRNQLAGSSASAEEKTTTQSMTQSFVGSISSLFFGRKGGLL